MEAFDRRPHPAYRPNTVRHESCLNQARLLPSPRNGLSVSDDGRLRGEGQGEGPKIPRRVLFPSPKPSPHSAHDAATHDELWGEGERGIAANFEPNSIAYRPPSPRWSLALKLDTDCGEKGADERLLYVRTATDWRPHPAQGACPDEVGHIRRARSQ
jgi:hypothetical protein